MAIANEILTKTAALLPNNIEVRFKEDLNNYDIENYLVILDQLLQGNFLSNSELIKIDDTLISYHIKNRYLLSYRDIYKSDLNFIDRNLYFPDIIWIITNFLEEGCVLSEYTMATHFKVSYKYFNIKMGQELIFKELIKFLIREGLCVSEAYITQKSKGSLIIRFPFHNKKMIYDGSYFSNQPSHIRKLNFKYFYKR